MPVTLYQSTDAGAPTLAGSAGSAIALLDACLVNGYGAKSPLGWAKEFSGTNKAAYRAAVGNRLYLRVDDSAPAATTARQALLRGYESMTDVDTGLELFPTALQLANGVAASKSLTADATARPWALIGDEQAFYLLTDIQTTGAHTVAFFGDIVSMASSDPYGTAIIGITPTTGTTAVLLTTGNPVTMSLAVEANHYLARRSSQVGGATQFSKATLGGFFSIPFGISATNNLTLPNPVDGRIYFSSPIGVYETSVVRGKLPGLSSTPHLFSLLSNRSTIAGVDGVIAGRTLYIAHTAQAANGTANTCYAIDITGPWR